MNLEERIIVALDVQTKIELELLIKELKGTAKFVKVGMELFYTFGPNIIKILKENHFKVFLDLKIHDIPNTALKSCQTITKLGADIINIHASGGIEMMKAAKQGVEIALQEDPSLIAPLLIAVTQLTSTDQKMLEEDLLINKPIHEVVVKYAKNAQEAGLDGVVSSPLEVKLIKSTIGNQFKCITPGIRPRGSADNDQKRVTTPKEAFASGSDYIVIGRAITQAKNPKEAFLQIVKEIKE